MNHEINYHLSNLQVQITNCLPGIPSAPGSSKKKGKRGDRDQTKTKNVEHVEEYSYNRNKDEEEEYTDPFSFQNSSLTSDQCPDSPKGVPSKTKFLERNRQAGSRILTQPRDAGRKRKCGCKHSSRNPQTYSRKTDSSAKSSRSSTSVSMRLKTSWRDAGRLETVTTQVTRLWRAVMWKTGLAIG